MLGVAREAVRDRIAGSANASVLANLEELKGLINTIVSNAGEDFIALLKPKAAKLFFVSSEDKETIFYKEEIRDRINKEFGPMLEAKPEGTTFRTNGTWFLERPNFSRKDGRRVFWITRIEVEVEAGITTSVREPVLPSPLGTPTASAKKPQISGYSSLLNYVQPTLGSGGAESEGLYFADLHATGERNPFYGEITNSILVGKNVPTHKGRDIFEVLWSAEVTMSKELKKPKVEEIKHVELRCAPIS